MTARRPLLHRSPRSRVAPWRARPARGAFGFTLATLALTLAYATPPTPIAARTVEPPAAAANAEAVAVSAGVSEPILAPANLPAAAPSPPAPTLESALGEEVQTHSARFRVERPSELPGWQHDNLRTAADTLRHSCRVLGRRATWSALCTQGAAAGGNADAMRAFFEREFVFLRVMNLDRSDNGQITGYFEPLLAGSPRRQGGFDIPVYGTPNDLLILDAGRVPRAQRHAKVWVRIDGREVRVLAQPQPGALELDLSRFAFDSRERRLRLRLDGPQLLPYYSREQLQARGAVDAPVLAWVDDPLGLYAMQVQGSGRIRMPDGSVLRLGYAEHNGHPFRPLRLELRGAASEPIVTRGGTAFDEPMQFDLDDVEPPAEAGAILTRGGAAPRHAAADPRVGAIVELLLGNAPRAAMAPANAPRPIAAPANAPRASASGAHGSGNTPPANAEAARAIDRDPSYVFFRVAADQSPAPGPIGALGVPLTAGRSVAVDPRVTPLGYPLWLAAIDANGDGAALRKLVFAQDTGGAIRGAVRADHFWGFGREAGRLAARTQHRGEIWLLMPAAEFASLKAQRLVTRGGAVPASLDRDCLVVDTQFCPDD